MTIPPVGLPRDPAAWLSIGVALGVVGAARPLFRAGGPSLDRAVAVAAAVVAAMLSAAYVAVYLRGGPRIIDATSYYLQARGLAEGEVSFPLGEPETAILGRFLLRSDQGAGPGAAVIFPPGYAAVLSLGFRAGAPLLVGPVLAAAIALVTFDLAGRVTGDRSPGEPSAPRVSIVFSVVCAALRYHTADTMSHGLAALCIAGALTLIFRAADAISARAQATQAAGAGLCLGWLVATRPVSAGALAVVLAAIFGHDRAARATAGRILPALALGAIPGAALLVLHQHAATGAWGASSQRLYYAAGDGPPGCFRYGFGAGVGCLGEHGDFVRAQLAKGYGFLAAAGTTLRRLKAHLVDPANLEPLALLVPAGVWAGRASGRVRALGLAVLAQILAYAPFYFDGNYPGGGGRFFCDVLPIEHVLAAVAVVAFASRRAAPLRWAAGGPALALLGFAFRAGFDHAALRDRDGGRPFFEPAVLAPAKVSRGLLFVDTDHGFDLAFDPGARGGLEVARFHGDALDRFVWEARGRPPAFRYRFEIPPQGPAAAWVEPLVFPDPGPRLVIEGESLWPALAQRDGWALPEWASDTCVSAGRWLEVHRRGEAPASITVVLPARRLSGRRISARVAVAGGARGEIALGGVRIPFEAPPGGGLACLDLPWIALPAAERIRLDLGVEGPGRAGLDALRVEEND
jgi:hypothetical protein